MPIHFRRTTSSAGSRGLFFQHQYSNITTLVITLGTLRTSGCRPPAIEVSPPYPRTNSLRGVLIDPRRIVTSFMANFTKNRDSQSSPISPGPIQTKQEAFKYEPSRQEPTRNPMAPSAASTHQYTLEGNESPQPRVQRERAPSRPMSMVQTYQPPLMDVAQDTLPELQPIFTFLNSHGNKLYQEGYFLKLDDQDTCK